MQPQWDNYAIQMAQAKKRFLTYDQQEILRRCRLDFDEDSFYVKFLGQPSRICRHTGDMYRLREGQWVETREFYHIMTLLDWLCDSREDRYISGRWVSVVSLGHNFHSSLQEDMGGDHTQAFDRQPEAFAAACCALGGEKVPGADVSFVMEVVDGLKVLLQLWHGDEEFPPRVCCLCDANTTRYIRYETIWYAITLLLDRIRENM